MIFQTIQQVFKQENIRSCRHFSSLSQPAEPKWLRYTNPEVACRPRGDHRAKSLQTLDAGAYLRHVCLAPPRSWNFI
jgi:hypothetical protein